MSQPQKISNEILELLEMANVVWTYKSEPHASRPHVKLTSGMHSDGFVDVGKCLKHFPTARLIVANYMVSKLYERWRGRATKVVGADTGSTLLAGDIANIMGIEHIRMIKKEEAGSKIQIWHPDNTPLKRSGELILHIEELLTTGYSPTEVRKGIRATNPDALINFVPFIPVVVERSNPDQRVMIVENSAIISLLQLSIRNFREGECRYCNAGSAVLEPKKDNNWARLTGK